MKNPDVVIPAGCLALGFLTGTARLLHFFSCTWNSQAARWSMEDSDMKSKGKSVPNSSPRLAGTTSAVDREALRAYWASLHGEHPELMNEVIILFLEEIPAKIKNLRHAVEHRDPEETRRLAHAIRGASHPVGATGLAELCRQIEMLGRERTLVGAASLLERTELEHGRVVDALLELITPDTPSA